MGEEQEGGWSCERGAGRGNLGGLVLEKTLEISFRRVRMVFRVL